jgi:hypothetical protein
LAGLLSPGLGQPAVARRPNAVKRRPRPRLVRLVQDNADLVVVALQGVDDLPHLVGNILSRGHIGGGAGGGARRERSAAGARLGTPGFAHRGQKNLGAPRSTHELEGVEEQEDHVRAAGEPLDCVDEGILAVWRGGAWGWGAGVKGCGGRRLGVEGVVWGMQGRRKGEEKPAAGTCSRCGFVLKQMAPESAGSTPPLQVHGGCLLQLSPLAPPP